MHACVHACDGLLHESCGLECVSVASHPSRSPVCKFAMPSQSAIMHDIRLKNITLRAWPCRVKAMQVPDRVGAHQQVPGNLAGPGLRVGQVQAASSGQRGASNKDKKLATPSKEFRCLRVFFCAGCGFCAFIYGPVSMVSDGIRLNDDLLGGIYGPVSLVINET